MTASAAGARRAGGAWAIPPLVALLFLGAGDRPALAQEPEEPAADSAREAARRAAAIARADSIRASLVQPPGSYEPAPAEKALGTAVEVLGTPFRLAFAGLTAVAEAVTSAVPPSRVIGVIEDAEEWGMEVDVSSVGPRSGEAIVLRFDRYEPFFVEGGQSLRGSRLARTGLVFGEPGSDSVPSALGAYTYQYNDEAHFWGIGPDTPDANESDFQWERHLVEAEGELPLGGGLHLGAVAGFEDNRVAGGNDAGKPDVPVNFDPSELFGLLDQTQLVHGGASLALDRFRWAGIQKRGYRLRFGLTAWEGVGGTDTDFHRFDLEAAGILPVSPRHALALRGLAEMTRGESRHEIPFVHLASLGSTEGLRGYPSDRFRDRDRVALMSEWRYEVWRDEPAGAEGFVFLDVGSVARSLDELATLRTSWGVGIRVLKERALLVLSYLAFSEEETRVALKFDWPF